MNTSIYDSSMEKLNEIVEYAISTFDQDTQDLILIGEMAELTSALLNAKRGREDNANITEELTHVLISCEVYRRIAKIDKCLIEKEAKKKRDEYSSLQLAPYSPDCTPKTKPLFLEKLTQLESIFGESLKRIPSDELIFTYVEANLLMEYYNSIKCLITKVTSDKTIDPQEGFDIICRSLDFIKYLNKSSATTVRKIVKSVEKQKEIYSFLIGEIEKDSKNLASNLE